MAVVADGVWLASHGQLQKRSFNGTVVTTLQVPHIVDVATDGNEVVALRASNSLGYSIVERFDVAGSRLGGVTLGISGMNADALELRASNGNFLLSGGVRLYECDRLTGAIVQVLEVGFFEQAALELVDGRLVSLNSGNATIVDVEGDPATASEVPGTAGRQFISIAPFDAGDPRARRFCPSGPNSSGAAAQIGVRGTTRTSDGTLWLDAFGGPAGAPGLFIFGASGAPQVVGNGTLCLGGPILRTGTLGTFDGAGNRAHVALPYAIDLAAGPVVTGSTWTFQYLFRDAAAGGGGFDHTDAIEVTFD